MSEPNGSTEVWKAVVGYEGWYEVSDHGRVKRIKAAFGTTPGKILKWIVGAQGYCVVQLSRESHEVLRTVHQLVMAAFVGPRPEGKEINHKDANKMNPRLDNLEYVTSHENHLHASRNGLMSRGEMRHNAVLTEESVRDILKSNERTVDICRRLGVSRSAINGVRRGLNWKHVKA